MNNKIFNISLIPTRDEEFNRNIVTLNHFFREMKKSMLNGSAYEINLKKDSITTENHVHIETLKNVRDFRGFVVIKKIGFFDFYLDKDKGRVKAYLSKFNQASSRFELGLWIF